MMKYFFDMTTQQIKKEIRDKKLKFTNKKMLSSKELNQAIKKEESKESSFSVSSDS